MIKVIRDKKFESNHQTFYARGHGQLGMRLVIQYMKKTLFGVSFVIP